jgi:hypothetical protein
MSLNINQFQQQPVLGDVDLQIAQSLTITGQLSANQATALVAGTPVKLDSAITSGRYPQFVAAGATDLAFGYIKRTVQAATFSSGDKIEVVGAFPPVMWLSAASTMAPGIPVQSNASDATIVEAVTSGKVRGILLDPAVTGQLVRVLLADPLALAS